MKKSLLLVALLSLSAIASAQSYHLENSGRINSSVTSYAAVNGNGGSLSHAEGSAQSVATGAVVSLPGSVAVIGDVSGYNKATAFNTSYGNGVGSASSVGWSDATVTGHSNSTLPFGSVNVSGTVDGGMQNPVRNGTDVNVTATTRQDGFVNADYKGGFSANGGIVQTPIAGGATVAGQVTSTQYADGQVVAGGVTFTGGTPEGQSAAVRFGNTGVEVKVDGRFIDPVGK